MPRPHLQLDADCWSWLNRFAKNGEIPPAAITLRLFQAGLLMAGEKSPMLTLRGRYAAAKYYGIETPAAVERPTVIQRMYAVFDAHVAVNGVPPRRMVLGCRTWREYVRELGRTTMDTFSWLGEHMAHPEERFLGVPIVVDEARAHWIAPER